MGPRMTPNVDTAQIQRWATRQLADYDSRQPGALFSEGVVLDLAQAYQLQSAVTELRVARGERVIGYKVGCTSPTIRTQLGIDHCVSGRLYATEQHPTGVALSRSGFANLAIEGELAVELSQQPHERHFHADEIPECVARVFPVIELHNHLMRGKQPSAGELIANNALHAGFVAGHGFRRDELKDRQVLDEATLSISAGDQLLDRCAGPALVRTIVSSLRWLTEVIRSRGQRLDAGQIVLTGSLPSLIPIVEDCDVQVHAPPFGNVTARFTS